MGTKGMEFWEILGKRGEGRITFGPDILFCRKLYEMVVFEPILDLLVRKALENRFSIPFRPGLAVFSNFPRF
jgi:hypothetical protein